MGRPRVNDYRGTTDPGDYRDVEFETERGERLRQTVIMMAETEILK